MEELNKILKNAERMGENSTAAAVDENDFDSDDDMYAEKLEIGSYVDV